MKLTDLEIEIAAQAAYEEHRDSALPATAYLWEDNKVATREFWRELVRKVFDKLEWELAAVRSPETAREETPEAQERPRTRWEFNLLPLNQEALRWLNEAKEPADPHLCYLVQLAFCGLEKGVRLHNLAGPSQEGIEEQVGILLGARDQANVYRWLLNNPNGGEMEEQVNTLTFELERAENPMEAAGLVLQTISSRMAAMRS